MENSFVDARVRAVREQLTLAHGQVEAAIEASRASSASTEGLEQAAKNLQSARASIDEIGSQIEADAGDAPALRRCPACEKSIRAAATLCGHCWTKL
jgi:hypothetical protein